MMHGFSDNYGLLKLLTQIQYKKSVIFLQISNYTTTTTIS